MCKTDELFFWLWNVYCLGGFNESFFSQGDAYFLRKKVSSCRIGAVTFSLERGVRMRAQNVLPASLQEIASIGVIALSWKQGRNPFPSLKKIPRHCCCWRPILPSLGSESWPNWISGDGRATGVLIRRNSFDSDWTNVCSFLGTVYILDSFDKSLDIVQVSNEAGYRS